MAVTRNKGFSTGYNRGFRGVSGVVTRLSHIMATPGMTYAGFLAKVGLPGHPVTNLTQLSPYMGLPMRQYSFSAKSPGGGAGDGGATVAIMRRRRRWRADYLPRRR